MQKAIGLILGLFLFLTACEDSSRVKPSSETPPPSESETAQESADKMVVTPLSVADSDQIQFVDWISNEEVIYIEHKNQESTIFKYHLSFGEKTPLFVTAGFVQLVEVSPERDQLLIQYSSNENEAALTILHVNGKVTSTVTIPSVEINTNWNQINQSKILVTAFSEDWSYKSYIWDTGNSQLESIELNHPFAGWGSESTLHYIDWDENQPSLLAPLRQIDFSGEITTLAEDVYFSKSFGKWFFTLSPSQQSDDKATYHFYRSDGKDLDQIEVFHLNSYSEWLIPYYDVASEKNELFFFEPVEGGAADLYNKGFLLSSYHVDSGDRQTLMEGLENLPIECSPNGSYCMYGYQLENILLVEEQKIVPLVKEEEN
ncbi:hypothetical protein SAMN05877753_102135 [Bacillus oleivorans]|uniref:YqgU-like 6-bladed beta-propeller domain-containing protein n=1 Tax=Bacillus oleivorans TaxID=1448271 RepID=A0A285CK23_9BACI|nr:hypothetical protein [Bacillus oleivorans]SNX67931.1 hypothetical protein SAMN05877753_102135 [Bacillus oleivorans]